MKAVTVVVFVVAALITATAFRSRKNMPPSPIKSNVKDFASDGLIVIPPTDGSFDPEVTLMVGRTEPEIKKLIYSAKPFCAVIKNTSGADLVGCRLEWNIIKEDGTNIREGQVYLNPGVLVGLEPLDERLVGHTSIINAHSSGVILLDQQANSFADARIKGTAAGTMPALRSDYRRDIDELSRQLSKNYRDISKSAKQFTISLESAIFSDGTFLGPDTDDLILNARAVIGARRELAKSIEHDLRTNKSPAEILKRLELLATETEAFLNSPGSQSTRSDNLHNRYKKLLVDELLDISRRGAGVNEAIEYTQRPLTKAWPLLRKIDLKQKG